jgi:hypothetical protein
MFVPVVFSVAHRKGRPDHSVADRLEEAHA